MIDWLAQHAGMIGLLLFVTMFLIFAAWAYAPSNKERMKQDAEIPFRENSNVN